MNVEIYKYEGMRFNTLHNHIDNLTSEFYYSLRTRDVLYVGWHLNIMTEVISRVSVDWNEFTYERINTNSI